MAQHRRALADVLEGLSADDWDAPTLCDGWDVRHVVGHILSPSLSSSWKTLSTVAKSGGYQKAFDRQARLYGAKDPKELVALLREHAENVWVPPRLGAAAPVTEIIVHSQDIVRPLGLELAVDPLEVDPALTLVVSSKSNASLAPAKRYAGLRLIATDIKWKFGKGKELEGPALELLMVLMGRGAALSGVSGPGFDLVSERI